MDKASDLGSEDCRFESIHDRKYFFPFMLFAILTLEYVNQDKALRKMSYSSASWSNFKNYQILPLRPRGHQESAEIW